MSPLPPPPAHVQPAFSEFAEAPLWDSRAGLSAASLTIRRPSAPPHARAAARPMNAGDDTYVVRPGDTLSDIAQRFSVSIAALTRSNGLSEVSTIRPGQRLIVPGGKDARRTATKSVRSRAAAATNTQVTVRAGDTVETIARRRGVSVAGLLRANGLSATSLIHPGQVLTVPGTTASAPAARDQRLAQAAAANQRYLATRPAPSRSAIRSMIIDTARRHGVDSRLALAIGWQESGWNHRSVSSANAIGAMQCLPSTARWMSGVIGRQLDLMHAQDAVTCGVALLRTLQRSARDETEVIAAYYQGLASVRANGMFGETKAYVASVLALKSRM